MWASAIGAVVVLAIGLGLGYLLAWVTDPVQARLGHLYKLLDEVTDNTLWHGSTYDIRQGRSLPAAARGLYQRYKVGHTDGSPVEPGACYFVLRLDNGAGKVHRRAGRRAALVYAREAACAPHLQAMCADLEKLVIQLGEEDADQGIRPGTAGAGMEGCTLAEQPEQGG